MAELERAVSMAKQIRALAQQAVRSLPADSHYDTARRVARKHSARPIDYMRYAEFEAILRDLHLRPHTTVLDVSSPQWFSLYLAVTHRDVEFIYINIVEAELTPYAAIAQALGLTNLHYQIADVRQLEFASDRFDHVISISVLEHIYPETDGDLTALQEIRRVLKPNGTLHLTIPYKAQRNIVYVDGPVYERDQVSRNFFAREYDRAMVDQLVEDSGFRIVNQWFISEQPGLLALDYYEWGPGKDRWLTNQVLKSRKLLELFAERSIDGWLAQRYLRVTAEPRDRLVNFAATLQSLPVTG